MGSVDLDADAVKEMDLPTGLKQHIIARIPVMKDYETEEEFNKRSEGILSILCDRLKEYDETGVYNSGTEVFTKPDASPPVVSSEPSPSPPSLPEEGTAEE